MKKWVWEIFENNPNIALNLHARLENLIRIKWFGQVVDFYMFRQVPLVRNWHFLKHMDDAGHLKIYRFRWKIICYSSASPFPPFPPSFFFLSLFPFLIFSFILSPLIRRRNLDMPPFYPTKPPHASLYCHPQLPNYHLALPYPYLAAFGHFSSVSNIWCFSILSIKATESRFCHELNLVHTPLFLKVGETIFTNSLVTLVTRTPFPAVTCSRYDH